MVGGESNMSEQADARVKANALIRHCNGLMGCVGAIIFVLCFGWLFLLPLALTTCAGTAIDEAQRNHPHEAGDATYAYLSIADSKTAVASTGGCVVLPVTLLLMALCLLLLRLRERIAQSVAKREYKGSRNSQAGGA